MLMEWTMAVSQYEEKAPTFKLRVAHIAEIV